MLIDGSNRGRPKKENEESVYRVREAIRVQNWYEDLYIWNMIGKIIEF